MANASDTELTIQVFGILGVMHGHATLAPIQRLCCLCVGAKHLERQHLSLAILVSAMRTPSDTIGPCLRAQ